ncbi:peptidase C19 family protein [Heterostelium album PN500]|uniref:ubiquitinyl hydrolase 1 n=1 Tax=Heterostelium pallidum (strain ATCC 26659 / Pp 5 / PN500) TaxID=670386 RepID=D3B1J5_HETP5|nr:peptidase C19 family protein [Heterostelium album PN500]EFA85169.1 peptidase C19 family protein [Heterostelium album PN500]|eukprot:XP_020437278.1 peptidase C19 family protein [Heterostelium album PN500]
MKLYKGVKITVKDIHLKTNKITGTTRKEEKEQQYHQQEQQQQEEQQQQQEEEVQQQQEELSDQKSTSTKSNSKRSKTSISSRLKKRKIEAEAMTESPGNTNQAVDSPQSASSFVNIQSDSSFVEMSSSTSPQPSPTFSSNSSYSIQHGEQVEEQNNMVVESSSSQQPNGVDVHGDQPADDDENAGVGSGSKKTTGGTKNTEDASTTTTTTTSMAANGVVIDSNNEYASLTEQERKEKNNAIKQVIKTAPLKLGEKWYLICKPWFDKWESNMYSPEQLGPIINDTLLITDTTHLRLNATEDQDFVVVPESTWDYFLKSYGCPTIIVRKVVKSLISLQIDYKYPQCLKFFKSSQPTRIIEHFVCKSETISSVKDRVCKLFDINPADVRVWDYYNNNKYAELKNTEYVSNSKLVENQLILLDERLEDGSWPPEKNHNTYSYSSRYNSRSGAPRPGVTGLDNLGNTCFMNSSLQCLSNTVPLTRYLLNDKHNQDLNRDNPLGCHGDLAIEYAKLIKQLWRGDITSTGPRELKSQIERFAPQFQGYHQHDSQELLAFLLDGLHEDLNKVKKKPFIEGKDYDNRPDEVIAKEQWDMHKARNDSVIVDWFQSQLKSRLVCPVCGKISITFDPFMYLSLPLPVNVRKQFDIVFVPYDSSVAPSPVKVEMPKTGVFEELLDIVSKQVNVEPERLVATMQSMSVIQKVYKPTQCVDIIGNRDTIVVYEIQGGLKNPEQFVNFKVTMKTSSYSNHFPFILSVPTQQLNNVEELYFHIIDRLKHLIKDLDKVRDVFSSNEKLAPQNEEEQQGDENDPYRRYSQTDHYSNYHQVMKKRPKDPRFIFQMAPDHKYERKEFEFNPVNFDSIILQWDEESFDYFFDSEKLQHSVPPYVFHRDVSAEKELTLEQCLELFTTVEQLGPDDPWYCSTCKEHQRATKKFVLKPGSTPLYDLFAVSNHYGSLGGGHYTAYGLNDLENQWIKFDDSSTHNVDPSHIVSDAAYVLFYRRRDTKDPDFYLNNGIKEFKDSVADLVATNPPPQTNGNSNGYESSSWYNARSSGMVGTGTRLGVASNRENSYVGYTSTTSTGVSAASSSSSNSIVTRAEAAASPSSNQEMEEINTNPTNGSDTADEPPAQETTGDSSSSLMEVE